MLILTRKCALLERGKKNDESFEPVILADAALAALIVVEPDPLFPFGEMTSEWRLLSTRSVTISSVLPVGQPVGAL